ncbi:hypothetical protein NA56DRAFT_15504 [Hyaloscypha hepaticicola]|uniref:Cora-domain-containing protein n=1 Tax=Hyaloscypha hepaticicola TaxID=2082293 RepID=A0A2J6QQF2_9HELO|nr:hypothetical protein NA56DRAFT_15504 [Hyaloscypha hepaticicola]
MPMHEGQPSRTTGSKLRILLGTCKIKNRTDNVEVSFTQKAFTMIKDRLGLPDYYLTNITRDHLARTSVFVCSTSERLLLGLIFKLAFYRAKFYQVSISYFPKANVTYGLILAEDSSVILQPLLSLVESYKGNPALTTYPLLLPMVAIERELERTSRRIHQWDKDINNLEEEMGQHEYPSLPMGNPLDMDFTKATRKLNHISKRVGVDILNLGYVKLSLETTESWGLGKDCAGKESFIEIEGEADQAMKEKRLLMREECRSLLLLADYEEKRMKILIQAVYQFMAQKGAKVNIELALSSAAIAKASKDDSAIMRQIAIETKRDSSAMKTIALLGMVFLPGTSVAAIFAMPVFNWDGDAMPVIKRGFGYYWAVTVPLTILVLISWGMAMLLPWRVWISRFNGRSRTRGCDTEL